MTKIPPIDSRILKRVKSECSEGLRALLDQLSNGQLIRLPGKSRKSIAEAVQLAALRKAHVVSYLKKIRDFHRDNDLLTAPPEKLLSFAQNMYQQFGLRAPAVDIKMINDGQLTPLFDYGRFRSGKILVLSKSQKSKRRFQWRKKAFCENVIDHLMEQYHEAIRFCPYCNAAPIYYYDNAAGTSERKNPFDHFFPKSVFPFLALSLYNLIPVCDRCNREKADRFAPIAYPHLDDLNQLLVFRPMITSISDIYGVSCARDSFQILIVPTGNDQRKRGCEFAREISLGPFYDANFRMEAKDVMVKAAKFTPAFQEFVKDRLSLRNISEAQRILFGTPLQSGDIHKHFLAKMTIDIHDFVQGEVLANTVK